MPGEGCELAVSALGAVVWWVTQFKRKQPLLFLQFPIFLEILFDSINFVVDNVLYSY